ncbi:MAG TPA: OmpA family protein [Chakrabartia sp.]|jgi:OOP family OmpA-OmpF porin|nr:OmpA family protein [Chakrabartia sp.]
MSNTMKLVLGAVVTALIAWVLHGPCKFGAKCAEAQNASAPAAAPLAAPEVPATAEAVKACQQGVDGVIKGKTINFASGGANISADSLALIESVASGLKDCQGTSIEIAGHTDLTGGDAANMALSQSRADSVAKALVERGIPANRLVAKGYGESKPLEAAMTSAANAKNRRIEFHVATSAAPAAAPAE